MLRAVNQERSSEDLAAVAREMAWGCVRNMSEIATAVGCDGRDVWIAEKQKRLHPDYEDNLIIAASIRLGGLASSCPRKRAFRRRRIEVSRYAGIGLLASGASTFRLVFVRR